MKVNIYFILPAKRIEFPQHSIEKIFLKNDSCHHFIKKHTTWEYMFFTLLINKTENVLRLYFSIFTLFSDFSN